MAPRLKSFQLLEINVISAQDLEPVSRKMRTYAIAWVHPSWKLSSSVDPEGSNNPTWNDKFVFKVDEEFLRKDTAAVMIEIFAEHWFRDVVVGSVHVFVGNLIPPPVWAERNGSRRMGMRFVALQVRRPSGRPQGILNIGVTLLNGSMRSMPLYTQLSASAVGYLDLMQHTPTLEKIRTKEKQNKENIDNKQDTNPMPMPMLRRSRSERSDRAAFDLLTPNSSLVAVAEMGAADKGSSIVGIYQSVEQIKGTRTKSKASSVISGAELREKDKHKGKKSRASSVLSDSIFSKGLPNFHKNIKKIESKNNKGEDQDGYNERNGKDKKRVFDEKPVPTARGMNNIDAPERRLIPKSSAIQKGLFWPQGKPVIGGKGKALWSDSDVGPSPSEVAAIMAERRCPPIQDNESSVLDGWSLDESSEALSSKLERWRKEMPPMYDHGHSSRSYKKSGYNARRHSDTAAGLFSCFGSICGYECQCVCGKPPPRRSISNSRFRSPSVGTSAGRSFL